MTKRKTQVAGLTAALLLAGGLTACSGGQSACAATVAAKPGPGSRGGSRGSGSHPRTGTKQRPVKRPRRTTTTHDGTYYGSDGDSDNWNGGCDD